MNRKEWIEMVLREIRFAPDRRKIRQELMEHMEDRLEEYMDEQQVLASMGDPTEVGRELNQQHKPWLGWLWMASWAALVVSGMLVLILAVIVGISSLADKPDTLDLEAQYTSKIRYYDEDYNHSGDVYYNWQTDYTVELLDTEITFRNFVYDDYDGRLVVYVTSEGPYAFGSNSIDVEINGSQPMSSERHEGRDEEGYAVGLYILTWERFDRDARDVTVSYDKFGERFAFGVNLGTGEVSDEGVTS